jgi:hypothetical protein
MYCLDMVIGVLICTSESKVTLYVGRAMSELEWREVALPPLFFSTLEQNEKAKGEREGGLKRWEWEKAWRRAVVARKTGGEKSFFGSPDV